MRKALVIIFLSISLAACVPATEADATTDTSESIEQGLFVSGGVHNSFDGSPGMTFITAMNFGDLGGEGFLQLPITITGPDGWNNNEPYTMISYVLAGDFYTRYTPREPVAAYSGSYTASVEYNETVYSSTFTVDANTTVQPVSHIVVVEAKPNRLEFSWDPAPGAEAYRVIVYDPTNTVNLGITHVYTVDTALVIDKRSSGDPLEAIPQTYVVLVEAMSSDTIATGDWDLSIQVDIAAIEPFEFEVQ